MASWHGGRGTLVTRDGSKATTSQWASVVLQLVLLTLLLGKRWLDRRWEEDAMGGRMKERSGPHHDGSRPRAARRSLFLGLQGAAPKNR
jgi:hypothetical protein